MNKKSALGAGGEKGDRTLDLRLMSPALYQLSYLAFCHLPSLSATADIIAFFAALCQWGIFDWANFGEFLVMLKLVTIN